MNRNRWSGRLQERGSALLLAIFFMIAMFFVASAYVQLLPVEARTALSDRMDTTASLAVEAGIIEALRVMEAQGPPLGDSLEPDEPRAMGGDWQYTYQVVQAEDEDGDPVNNVYTITSTATLFGQPWLVATVHVTTDDFFGPMSVSGRKTDLHLHNKKGTEESSVFSDPIHSNSEMKLKVHDNNLPDPGPLFDRLTYGDGKKKDIDIKPKLDNDEEWARFVNGGEAGVYQAPNEWIADLSDKKDKKPADKDNVINGAENSDSLMAQVLNGTSEPKKAKTVLLPAGGGVYIPDKVSKISMLVAPVASLYDGSGSLKALYDSKGALQLAPSPNLLSSEVSSATTVLYTENTLYDADNSGKFEAAKDGLEMAQVVQIDFQKAEPKTVTTDVYEDVWDPKKNKWVSVKTGTVTSTVTEYKNTWWLVLDQKNDRALLVDNTGSITSHDLPNGIFYVDDKLNAIEGINLGQKTMVAEKDLKIEYKANNEADEDDGLVDADFTEVTRSLVPWGTDYLNSASTPVRDDLVEAERMTQYLNGISLIAGKKLKINTHSKDAPDLGDYYLYANLLAGEKIEVKSHEKSGASFYWYGSMMSEGDIKLHLHDKEEKGSDAGDFFFTQDDGNMNVLGLNNTNFTIVHYVQTVDGRR